MSSVPGLQQADTKQRAVDSGQRTRAGTGLPYLLHLGCTQQTSRNSKHPHANLFKSGASPLLPTTRVLRFTRHLDLDRFHFYVNKHWHSTLSTLIFLMP
jgi:hypothetical protein